MIAFAMYLFEQGADDVRLHPDGEHLKRYEMADCLNAEGFDLQGEGTGVYRRGRETITVKCRSGLGDVVGKLNDSVVVAECKGGVINTRHSGPVSKLRRGLCEAVGLLMARSLEGERHVAVVPAHRVTESLGLRMLSRANKAGIEIALVEPEGNVIFLSNSAPAS